MGWIFWLFVVSIFCFIVAPWLSTTKPSPKKKLKKEIKDLMKKLGLRCVVSSYLRESGKTEAYEKLLTEMAEIHKEIEAKQHQLEELRNKK